MLLQAPRALAWILTAVAAATAAGLAARAVAPLGPALEIDVFPLASHPMRELVEVRIQPVGGETIPLVRVEVASGDLAIEGRTLFLNLPPTGAARVQVRILRGEGARPGPAVLRVRQGGAVERVYDVPLPRT